MNGPDPSITFLTDKRFQLDKSWDRKVSYGGEKYWIGVQRGKRARNSRQHRGYVRKIVDDRAITLFEGGVIKKLGAPGLLRKAGVIRD